MGFGSDVRCSEHVHFLGQVTPFLYFIRVGSCDFMFACIDDKDLSKLVAFPKKKEKKKGICKLFSKRVGAD